MFLTNCNKLVTKEPNLLNWYNGFIPTTPLRELIFNPPTTEMEKSIFGNTPSDIQQFDQQLLAINKATAEFAKVKTVEDLNRINAKLAAVIANLRKLETTNVIKNT